MNEIQAHIEDAQRLPAQSVLRHDCPVCGDAMDSMKARHDGVTFGHSDGRVCESLAPKDRIENARMQLRKAIDEAQILADGAMTEDGAVHWDARAQALSFALDLLQGA